MIVSSQLQLFDLKSFLPIGHNSATSRKEIAYREYRQNHFFSNHGFCSIVSFSAMRCSLPRKPQSDYVHLLGSVSLHGLRSTHLSRKPQGHRGMSSRGEAEAISYGHQEQRITKYSGPCQREPRLENLCRLCPSADQDRQRIIRERRLRLGIKTGRLRLRFNDYRSLPFGISLGQVPQNQSRSEASHLVGSPGQHPRCDQYYQRQNSRCQRARRSCLRAWSHLYFRQGICRLRPALPDSSITRVFCNARKKQFRFQASLLTASGQVNRDTGRPDHYGHRFLHAAGLSRETQANPILRYRHKEALCFSDQQLHATSNRDREALQMPLESELFFKWIKQHLRIKSFYGTSENALKTQIWIAISVYVLVAIVKKRLKLDRSLYTILQILSVTMFEKTPILQALSLTDDQTILDHLCKQ